MIRKQAKISAVDMIPALRQWYERELGQCLFDFEQRELDKVLPGLFGYHLLQVGSPNGRPLYESSLIAHRLYIDNMGLPAAPGCRLRAQASALPIATDSVDVVILPHTLEFEADPHQVLREIDRVLVPEGHVVILGFNPWSLWGLRSLVTRRWASAPWGGQFRSVMRLKDWLLLLGFETIFSQSYFFRPPLQAAGIMRRLGFMEALGKRWCSFLGAGNIIVARKRVVAQTPIKPRWRPRRSLVNPAWVKPTVNCHYE